MFEVEFMWRIWKQRRRPPSRLTREQHVMSNLTPPITSLLAFAVSTSTDNTLGARLSTRLAAFETEELWSGQAGDAPARLARFGRRSVAPCFLPMIRNVHSRRQQLSLPSQSTSPQLHKHSYSLYELPESAEFQIWCHSTIQSIDQS